MHSQWGQNVALFHQLRHQQNLFGPKSIPLLQPWRSALNLHKFLSCTSVAHFHHLLLLWYVSSVLRRVSGRIHSGRHLPSVGQTIFHWCRNAESSKGDDWPTPLCNSFSRQVEPLVLQSNRHPTPKLFCGWLPWVVNQAENQNETSTSLEQPKGQLELLLVQAHRELRQRLWLSALDIDSLALDHQQGHPSHPSHPDSSPTLSLWNLHHDQKLKPLFHEEMCEEGKRQDLNKNLRKAHWRVGSKGRCQLLATMPVLDWQLQIPKVHDDDLFDVQMPVNYSYQRYLDVLLQVNVTI